MLIHAPGRLVVFVACFVFFSEQVTLSEFQKMLAVLGLPLTPEEVVIVFDAIDEDGT